MFPVQYNTAWDRDNPGLAGTSESRPISVSSLPAKLDEKIGMLEFQHVSVVFFPWRWLVPTYARPGPLIG